jgi:hypothetical protein
MNETLLQACSLTPLQQLAITRGIKKGFGALPGYLSNLPVTGTNNYKPKLRGDIINDAIEREILSMPETGLFVEHKKAVFHEYIALRDVVRQVSILVQNLPSNRQLLPYSRYRGEFSSSNIDRLISVGFSDQEFEQLELDLSGRQTSLPMEPQYFQFCIVVCYDGKKGADTKIVEGALAPNQEQWIYRKDITDIDLANVEHLEVAEAKLPKLKKEFEEPNYGLKLKDAK